MIEVREVIKDYIVSDKRFRAINKLSFKVDKGEIYGIIGLSGAGKSTLIRCLNRLEEIDDGKIFIDGINITSLSEKELLKIRKQIGMVFQSFNLFNQKNVFENIAYPLKLLKLPKKEILTRVNELLKFIDLEDKKFNYPSEISGGQQQRVAIARAIATRPKVILCDEATSALDPSNTKQILELLKKTVKEYDTTIIMITHQMEVAKDICDRIAVMENGKIIEENTVEQLFKNPKHHLTMKLVDANKSNDEKIDVNKLKGSVSRISYSTETANEPILSSCIKQFGIDVNILAGDINQLGSKKVGYMYLEFIGDYDSIYNAKKFLMSKNVTVEEVYE